MGGGRGTEVIRLLTPAGGALATGAIVLLDEDESRHLTVRRAESGASVTLLDGAGASAVGRLERAGREWKVEVGAVRREARPVPLTLAVGAGDRDRFALMVEQAAQLGASTIVPLLTERTAGVATRLRDGHLERLQRRGREALKQCGGSWAPTVAEPRTIGDFLTVLPAGACWLADPEGGPPPALRADAPVIVAVGPEGGFTTAERRSFLDAGFQRVRLGQYLLRFETAAIAALTAVWLSREERAHG